MRLLPRAATLSLVFASTPASAADVGQRAESGPSALKVSESGFRVETFAANVPDARSMALGDDGTVYVGTRRDRVYAIPDRNGDHRPDDVHVIATGLNMPNGVALLRGDLYVAEVGRVLVWRSIAKKLPKPGAPEVVTDAFPEDKHHGWKFIAFGPDGKLYVPVGAPCNICKSENPIYASITRMNPDGSDLEVYAHGVRNSVGFDWHPKTKALWFTDNGRDHLGDDLPPCELNQATRPGQHFGYPYCHGGDVPDPEFGKARKCSEFRQPRVRLQAHAAPLGMRFYTGEMFPKKYRGSIILAEHGSWNRSRKVGYRVMRAQLGADEGVERYEPLVTGWLDDATQKNWGRPVDIQTLKDGSVLISDDGAGAIYRLVYTPPKTSGTPRAPSHRG